MADGPAFDLLPAGDPAPAEAGLEVGACQPKPVAGAPTTSPLGAALQEAVVSWEEQAAVPDVVAAEEVSDVAVDQLELLQAEFMSIHDASEPLHDASPFAEDDALLEAVELVSTADLLPAEGALPPAVELTPTGELREMEEVQVLEIEEVQVIDEEPDDAGPATPKAEAAGRPVPLGAGALGSLAALRKIYGAEGGPVTPPPKASLPGSQPVSGSTRAETEEEGPEDLEDEWTQVEARTEEMRLKELSEAAGKIQARGSDLWSPISAQEVAQWLAALEVDEDTDVVEGGKKAFRKTPAPGAAAAAPRRGGGWGCCLAGAFGGVGEIPGLHRRLARDRDLVLLLRRTHFDLNDLTHFRMLRTMYTKLTRNKTCGVVGGHWAELGFQHTDPRSDLNRSGGVLNVLHLFHFFCRHFEVLKAAFLLAQDEQQNFPLFCISINLTKLVMEAFFAGRLSSLCNSLAREAPPRTAVLEATQRAHAAALWHFYTRWRGQKRTIRDTEKALKEVEAALRRPGGLLKAMERGLQEQKARADPARFEFTDLDFGTARGQQPAPAREKSGSGPELPKRLRNYHDNASELS